MPTTHQLGSAPDSTPVTTPGAATRGRRLTRWINRRTVGCFYLFTAGIHVGLASADAEVYRHVADEALFAFVLPLMLLGWGYWMWCVPALAVLVPAARAEVRR